MNPCYEKCFETLSNKLRIEILETLQKKPMSVNELSKKIKAEQSRISHALQRLKMCNYVISTKEGKERIYSLNPNVKKQIGSIKKGKLKIFEFMDHHINHVCHKRCKKE